MSIVIMQTFTAAEGKYAALAEMLAAMLPATAARPGAEFMHAAGDPAAGVITIYEQWDGSENQQAYVAWRMQQPGLEKVMALIAAPPKIEQLVKL